MATSTHDVPTQHPGYLRSGWNVLDLVVVLVSFASALLKVKHLPISFTSPCVTPGIFLSICPRSQGVSKALREDLGGVYVSAVRILRVFRLLKFISGLRGLQLLVSTLSSGLPALLTVATRVLTPWVSLFARMLFA